MKPGSLASCSSRSRDTTTEQAHRIVDAGVPLLGIDPPEQVARVVVPRPTQVHRERLERAAAPRGGWAER